MTAPVEQHPVPQPWAPTYRTVRLDGRRVRVAEHGSGPPLLLLNGIGANIEMWAPLAALLPGRRLIAFDFPGTGGSQPLRRSRRMPGMARLVVELLDVLELPRVDVLGYSWGGALAQELARSWPWRVRAMVLAATIPGLGGQPPAPWVLGAMSTPVRYYSPTYLRLIAPIVFGTRLSEIEAHHRARRDRPPTLRGYSHQLLAITGWSSLPWLGRLRTPVLVLAGEGDPLSPARNGRLLARRIPGARLEVLPGGHLFLLQHPDRAARAVRAFLEAQDRQTRSTT